MEATGIGTKATESATAAVSELLENQSFTSKRKKNHCLTFSNEERAQTGCCATKNENSLPLKSLNPAFLIWEKAL